MNVTGSLAVASVASGDLRSELRRGRETRAEQRVGRHCWGTALGHGEYALAPATPSPSHPSRRAEGSEDPYPGPLPMGEGETRSSLVGSDTVCRLSLRESRQ